MKCKILLAIVTLFYSIGSTAQKKRTTAYAITSAVQGQFVWTEVKLIDLNTGEVLQKVFENDKPGYLVFNARDGKSVQVKTESGVVTDINRLPFAGFSAACGFDKKHNRLYYTPVFFNELRYIDLNTGSAKFFYFSGEAFSTAASVNDEANHITRMVIGEDGNGYALSNDGNHFIKFTTNKKPVITDMGALQDDVSNDKISVHNRCTSWGGDMIASADGSLYLVSAFHSIFKIDINNRTAKYISNISGLPAGFSSNGAVVGEEGKMIVSSANSTDGYYEVDMENWTAAKIPSNGMVYNTSDLANENIAFQKKQLTEPAKLISRNLVGNNKISLYPNPVSEGMFRVSFDNDELGRYDVQLVDLAGRLILHKVVTVGNKGQVVEIELKNAVAKGTYLVKVLGNNKKAMYADKIIID